MSSYVLDINPFKGVLCVPYYHLFIAIITSWLFAFLRVYYAMQIDKYYNINVVEQKNQIEGKVPSQIQQDIKTSIQSSTNLPHPIISIITQMLPKADGYYQSDLQQEYKEKFEKQIERKARNYLRTIYIYPAIRYTINCINLINIMVRYGKWVNNTDFAPWHKYMGFILVWFYMPLCKGYIWALYACFDFFQREKDQKYYGRNLIVADTVYQMMERQLLEMFGLIAFGLLAIPMLFFGFFVYITTIFGGLLVGIITIFMFAVCATLMNKIWFKGVVKLKEDNTGLLLGTSFCANWLITLFMVSIMEFSNDVKWVKGYRIGLLGEYCDPDDYFSADKWNQYEWDIQLLIVSWFLF